MPSIGYLPGTNADDYAQVGTANSLNQRASVFAKMTEDGWAYQATIRGGRVTSVIPRVALAAWGVGSGTSPVDLVARTAEFTTGTFMLDETDGTSYTRPFQTAGMFRNGKRYAGGFNVNDAPFGYGTISPDQLPTGEVYDEFRRTVASGPTPQDPFSASSTGSNIGWMAVSIDYETNVPPNIPTSTNPSNGAAVSNLTPTFAGNFRDDNETLPNGLAGDSLATVQIQVRATGTTSLLWNITYNASAAERTARRFSAVYGGSSLTNDVSNDWRARVADQYGAWSPWTNEANTGQAWDTFTVTSGYIDTSAGTPHAKQLTTSPGPFTGIWQHAGGLSATQLRMRILAADGTTVLQESPYVTIGGGGTIVGGTMSKTFGSFTALSWGSHYTYALQAKDSAGVETQWSSVRTFSIDAAPSIPLVVAPLNGAVSSSRPELVVTSTDPDADDLPGVGHVVSARIKNSTGTVLFTRTMAYDAVTQTFRYQTTSTDLATTADYRFDFYASDGTVYSGGNTVLGAGALSTEITFTYSTGPVITHVAPVLDAAVGTDIPFYNWSVTGQVRKRIRVWELFGNGTQQMIFDSGQITNTDTNFTQPAGYLHNGGSYYRIIDVWNISNQQGTSTPAYFTVDYSDATELSNFLASPHRVAGDVTPSAVILSHNGTTYTADQFQDYVYARRATDDNEFDVDDEVQAENVRIAIVPTPSLTTFIDYLPASGTTYVYGAKQIVEVDGVVVSSDYVHSEITINFQETIICDARHGGARRVVFQARSDRTTTYEREQVVKAPWGTTKPIVMSTNRWGRTVSGEFIIVADTPEEAESMVRAGEKLHQRGGPHCYRDGRGRRYFGEITAFTRVDPPGGKMQRIQLTFLQTNAHEVIAT
jgi:hypothetical protein